MRVLRCALIVALGLLLPSATMAGRLAEPPRIMKPQPAPNTSPNVPPLPPAKFDPSLAVGGDEVKARKVETRLSVDVMVNGRGPYKFIVDSGADTSAVGLNIARQLELPLGTPAILNGMTARNLVDRVKVDSLTLGPSTIRNLQLPALREVDMGGAGMIGIDALVRQRLMMDFDRHLIKVEDARTRMQTMPGDIVITARRERGQLILAEVRAADQRLDAIIDTGTEVTVGNIALRDKLVRKHRAAVRTLEMIGVTGETIKVQLAIIDELQLGPVLIRDVPIAFADLPPFKLFGLAKEPALLLGTDILENFRRVSLDFRSRKVRFQLRRCTTEGVIISTNPENFSRLSAVEGTDTCSK
ncbi:MAG TPA: aspartyl protease family protein [Sphingomicrobium sp.]|nr:aspartyl protease family protein [Sphingomicrobium sp.]